MSNEQGRHNITGQEFNCNRTALVTLWALTPSIVTMCMVEQDVSVFWKLIFGGSEKIHLLPTS
jgi:hypothetical protein